MVMFGRPEMALWQDVKSYYYFFFCFLHPLLVPFIFFFFKSFSFSLLKSKGRSRMDHFRWRFMRWNHQGNRDRKRGLRPQSTFRLSLTIRSVATGNQRSETMKSRIAATMEPFYTTARAWPALGSAQLGLGASWRIYISCVDQTWIRGFTSFIAVNVSPVLNTSRLMICVFQTADDARLMQMV